MAYRSRADAHALRNTASGSPAYRSAIPRRAVITALIAKSMPTFAPISCTYSWKRLPAMRATPASNSAIRSTWVSCSARMPLSPTVTVL